MHLFTFEPGDGVSYRILFGRLPSTTSLIPFYVVFGIAEGSSETGAWYAFDTEVRDFDTFERHMLHRSQQTRLVAWRVYCVLIGLPDEAVDLDWRDDWRTQIPPAAFG